MLDEIVRISVPMLTETVNEKEMRVEALRLLGAEMIKMYGGGKIADRINKVMAKLDSVSGHGGVKLNISIP